MTHVDAAPFADVADPRVVAMLRSLGEELEESQWLPPEAHAARQGVHLGHLVRFARERVPFHSHRLEALEPDAEGRIAPGQLARIPVMTRADAQAAGEHLLADPPPAEDGALRQMKSSGSTGRPIEVTLTDREILHRMALSIRRHRWGGRDATRRLASIRFMGDVRAAYPDGLDYDEWQAPVRLIERTGRMHALHINTPVSQQLEWLVRKAPDYLVTHPSNLRALLELSARTGERPAGLATVNTVSEAHPEGLRALLAEIWGAALNDNYSCIELGSIATQCPGGSGYHAHEETMIVEILDDDDRPAPVGALGRVVLTPLFNRAMPLIRYAPGDVAVRGERCACGRGLQVIGQIAGRVRNMMRLPGGDLVWPQLGIRQLAGSVPIDQFQVVQTALDALEVRVVTTRAFEPAEETALAKHICTRLGRDFAITVRHLDAIPHGPGMKYEDFICAMDDESSPRPPQSPPGR